jgi:hypothetical protein
MNRHRVKALVISGLIVTGAFALAFLEAHGFIPEEQREIATRGYNVTIALILACWGNLAPKRLHPLGEMGRDPGTEQSIRRFAGVAILGCGLLSALDWMIAPFELALPIEAAAIGGALVVVGVRFAHRHD